MFYYDEEKLKSLAAEFRAKVQETFPDSPSFSIPAALAACMTGPCDMDWTMEHYYAKLWTPVIPAMVRLYDALVIAGHDVTNSYEISSCDRYVGYVKDDCIKARVMLFENQNLTYVVVIGDGYCFDNDTSGRIDAYKMHVRVITPSRNSVDNMSIRVENVDQKMLKGCDSDRYDDKASDYFRYQDLRDRGFIVTVEPELVAHNGKPFYKIERPGSAHPSSNYILSELSSYRSMMDETVEELLGSVDN